ncbi:MAG: MFS transporter [Acidimicrobiaceae bacterium]|nr:MFS transporter [Acidimicrobiaceae bacterium]
MVVLQTIHRGTCSEIKRELAKSLQPRVDIVEEKATDDRYFEAVSGPFLHYQRRLELHCDTLNSPEEIAEIKKEVAEIVAASLHLNSVQKSPDDAQFAAQFVGVCGDLGQSHRNGIQETADNTADNAECWELLETITYRLAFSGWSWLFHFPVKNALRRRRESYGYWWASPDRLNAKAASVLGLLCIIQLVDGYLGTVLTQTLTFAAEEFGRGNTAQGIVLSVVRAGVLISLLTVTLADRYSRKRLLVISGLGSCVATAAGALSPGLWLLAGTQLIARGLSTALGIIILIISAEEMPARSRAWAVSVLAIFAGLGAGIAVIILPATAIHPMAWRVIYLVPLVGVVAVVRAGRRLPESYRGNNTTSQSIPQSMDVEAAARRRQRLQLLAGVAFLSTMFLAPTSGLQNDFLKDERGFSVGTISVFRVVTNLPAGIGLLVGGHLADRIGRRPVSVVGLIFGTAGVTGAFFADGAELWTLMLTGMIFSSLVVPALGVYGPELFSVNYRGRANGIITIAGVLGGALGFLIAGWLSDVFNGQLGSALAFLTSGPLIVVVLILWKYPETTGMELEGLNPEDKPNPEDRPLS